ncbi:MAG: tetratricopeptide repeat protein [Ignavibacteriaceae bacterium]|jgi:photosystem II stability/assembly factor-like uncharacterized protein/Tfp pilus assembly protein PilF
MYGPPCPKCKRQEYSNLGDCKNCGTNYNNYMQMVSECDKFYNAAVEYAKNGNTQKAIELYSKAISVDHYDESSYNNRGVEYCKLKDYISAISDFSSAIQINPVKADSFSSRGNCYDILGEYDKAILDQSKAIELKPHNNKYWNNRGVSFLHMKKYQAALSDFDKAIGLDMNDKIVHANRAKTYLEMKEYEKSIKEYDWVIDNYPNYSAFNNRGNVNYTLKYYEKAIADWENAIRCNIELERHLREKINQAKILVGDIKLEYEIPKFDTSDSFEPITFELKNQNAEKDLKHETGQILKTNNRLNEDQPNNKSQNNNKPSKWMYLNINAHLGMNIDKIVFSDEKNGYFISNFKNNISSVYKTINGGQNWQEIKYKGNTLLNDIFFLNSETGFIVGGNVMSGETVFLRTTNGGSGWEKVKTAYDEQILILFSVDFENSNHGIITGNYGRSINEVKNIIFFTDDAGMDWKCMNDDAPETIEGNYYKKTKNIFARPRPSYDKSLINHIRLQYGKLDILYSLGYNLIELIFSNNQGITWQKCQTSVNYAELLNEYMEIWGGFSEYCTMSQFIDSKLHINAIDFFDHKKGLAVGNGGTILFTDNGGRHWKSLKYNSELKYYNIINVFLTTSGQGYLITQPCNSAKHGKLEKIFVSNDEGKTWRPIEIFENNWKASKLYKKSFLYDGYSNFDEYLKDVQPRSILLRKDNKGFIVGDKGLFLISC